jgi:glycosyltransferase involved in cell wall biosynthesis
MLRYETEFTPCTGITAVTKQERRHFTNGVIVAPWCSRLRRNGGDDPVGSGLIRDTGIRLDVRKARCKVLATTDDFAPIVFLDVPGRFLGVETPYDTPPEPPELDSLATLKTDTLWFALAVDALLRKVGHTNAFVWGADWETVPALFLLRPRHHVSLTLHNTFDECLAPQADAFGAAFEPFRSRKNSSGSPIPSATALQIGLELADVVTTVNRGFADGMRREALQQDVMARHLRHLLGRVIGIDNAAFAPLAPELVALRRTLRVNFDQGCRELYQRKRQKVDELPDHVRERADGKAIVVSMGRRVSQKQHDVLVESLRTMLESDPAFPVLAVFATVHGDAGSPARLARIRRLAEQYPSNVICEDGQLPYYEQLMAAADFNCMPSLYEPHGGAFEGTVVPIARAVDGLAEQICGLAPVGAAEVLNARWHSGAEEPAGFLFRESDPTKGFLFADGRKPVEQSLAQQLRALLETSPTPDNSVFRAMRDSLTDVLRRAIRVRLERQDEYARLVLAALDKQEGTSWHVNLGGMLALIEQARSPGLRHDAGPLRAFAAAAGRVRSPGRRECWTVVADRARRGAGGEHVDRARGNARLLSRARPQGASFLDAPWSLYVGGSAASSSSCRSPSSSTHGRRDRHRADGLRPGRCGAGDRSLRLDGHAGGTGHPRASPACCSSAPASC